MPGLAAAYGPYREELRRRGAIDFDEQVFGAVEALLRDGELRRAVQADHRHLLVDELQDLTPAHVLLVRLASAPGLRRLRGRGRRPVPAPRHAGRHEPR